MQLNTDFSSDCAASLPHAAHQFLRLDITALAENTFALHNYPYQNAASCS